MLEFAKEPFDQIALAIDAPIDSPADQPLAGRGDILGNDPTRRIICASYSAELAFKLSNDFRAVIDSTWYRHTFPNTQVGRYKDSEGEIEFTHRGLRLATSVGGTLTGRGGDLIIIDDPLKPVDALSEVRRNGVNEWMVNTVLSRLDDKKTGAIVIVMQRVHLDDLTGFVRGLSDDWTVLGSVLN